MRQNSVDTLLIGGGIMSVTLASLIHQLDPSRSLCLVEQGDQLATESSDGWNNAGTGHAGYCELNYTPRQADGAIDIRKAVAINESFEQSLQYWSSLVRQGTLENPASFINPVPHLSFVQGENGVEFLRQRHEALSGHPLFKGMEWTTDSNTLDRWLPLMMAGRRDRKHIAATRVGHGADVDFGSLTRQLGYYLGGREGVDVRLGHRVTALRRVGSGWQVHLQHLASGERMNVRARFVFIGAGGASLHLLQQARLPEARGYAGFPVSGLWLVCRDQALAARHEAKVYGMPPTGAPPMSVPHLDTRIINGRRALLFGPFAGITTRFLKNGHPSDLVRSLKTHNIKPMMDVEVSQWSLTKYLLKEGTSRFEDRLTALAGFSPMLAGGPWELVPAGQRVQIIKRNARGRGTLEFGTEVITASDGSMAALMGASPGASVSTSVMLSVIERCLPELCQGLSRQRLRDRIPSWGYSLAHNPDLLQQVRRDTLSTLGLKRAEPGFWPETGAA